MRAYPSLAARSTTPLAGAARDLRTATSSPDRPALHAGDLDVVVHPMVARWRDAARAAILLTDQELPALGPLTSTQVAALAADAALLRDALTSLAAGWEKNLHDHGETLTWPDLPAVPALSASPDWGIDRLGWTPPRPPRTRPGRRDGVAETLWALETLAAGLHAATPHARAATEAAASLTRISEHATTLGRHPRVWSARVGVFESLWLRLQDVHSGAGAQQGVLLAIDAANAFADVRALAPDEETALLDAVAATSAALHAAVSHATRTHLYAVITDYRIGPVVRATRQLLPVYQLATPEHAPDLNDAIDALQPLPTVDRPNPDPTAGRATPQGTRVAGGVRDRLSRRLRTYAEAVPPAPVPTSPPTDPAVARAYRRIRTRIADNAHQGPLPPLATLARDTSGRRPGRSAATLAVAHLVADGHATLTEHHAPDGGALAVTIGARTTKATYATIYTQLRTQIENGLYTGRLPRTKDLAAEHGVTTTVIHHAAAALARDGLVYRVRGSVGGGTYVAPRPTAAPPPLWRIIRDDLRTRITTGTLTGQIPSLDQLARDYGASTSTIHRAISHLTTDGLLYQRLAGPDHGGTFVIGPDDPLPEPQWRPLHDTLRTAILDQTLTGDLPTPATLARQHDVDPLVAATAVARLAAEGLVYHRISGNRRGLAITPRTDRPNTTRAHAIYTDLRATIIDGTATGRLPSRTQLAREYGTSTGPPGEAIRRLVAEGLARTVTGTGPSAGTFVATAPPEPPRPGTPWTKIHDLIRDRITDGTYTGRLPRPRDLAAEHHVSTTTIYKALRRLAATGRVQTVNDGARSGTYAITPDAEPAPTTRWRIYDDLRARIQRGDLTGRLPTHATLAAHYGTSTKPIAFAVHALAHEGLLDVRPGHGTSVVPRTPPRPGTTRGQASPHDGLPPAPAAGPDL
ncbi:GntR family transcriptional regulator [Xylanimonas allomyrinae]|uniref:GntR family transcriptional regulator n=1 Tax=Xylanimonas allomyrinae TaxID=2509459 RepID=A0A4P6EPF2_9MICO|nr:GntR family transcriptional regulator [Xylanimonas allomyrinae]